ncbi:hypothetical protein E8E13_003733 [Curvularia kusanoi]|uniref:Geranylgeranyl pyrophosphate synthetase n=1 Tax=Curvularia kusanoi TaxID=90978 RepID=A0A9P4W6H4_CURKU|nr:hypothetical protein E8E13_003733 [Curvularia kusanoi]
MPFTSDTYRGRGGFAPRRGRGGWSQPFAKRQDPKPDLQKHPLGDLILALQRSDLKPLQAHQVSPLQIQSCKYVTSYNWLANEISTVTVPGQPPQWTPLKVSRRLKEDSGIYYRDPNAARSPEYPMAPAVQATLDAMEDKSIDFDLFACGSTLGSLLRFTRGIDKAFRFHVQVVGGTVFLIRQGNDPKELIEGVRGFGHSFPEAYTTWPKEVKGSETHQRIVQYKLGDLQCLLRFECDGFFDDLSEANNLRRSVVKETYVQQSEDALVQAFSGTAVSNPHTNNTGAFSVVKAGKPVPQASIFDLKTRSGRHKKDINMDDITPLLWLKQVPNFIVAYHDGAGLFPDQDIHIKDVQSLTATFEKDNAEAIHSLVSLLQKIIDLTKEDDRGLLEVYCSGNGVLEIRKQFGQGVQALPVDLHGRWVAKCDSGGMPLCDEDTDYGSYPDDSTSSLSGLSGDSDQEDDFTACSEEVCGYCGRCTY